MQSTSTNNTITGTNTNPFLTYDDTLGTSDNCDCPKLRWIVIFLSHLALLAVTIVASSLSLTIVAMTGEDSEDNSTITLESGDECKLLCNGSYTTISPRHVVDLESNIRNLHVTWSETEKDYMLQALFWGASALSPLGGRIGEILGPRWTVATCLLVISLLNLLYPMAVLTNYWIAYVIRVIQGMGQGLVIPSLYIIISHWSTDYDKTLSNSIVQGGIAMANMLVHPFVGLLISNQSVNNWPIVFYSISLFNFVIFAFWYLIVYDYPETHPYLSQQELILITSHRSLKSSHTTSVPWRRLISSPPVIAYLTVAFTYGWLISLVSTQIPSFYKQVLGLSLETNGLVNALPWLLSFIISLTGSFITDYISANSSISLTKLRKYLALLGLGSGSLGIVAITSFDWSNEMIVALVTLSKGLATLNIAGPGTSHLDISPSFAGTLAGIANLCANLSALVMNQSIVSIVGDYPSRHKWFHFFHLTSGLSLGGLFLFILMGSAKVQPWDPSYQESSVDFRTPLNTHYHNQISMNTFS